MCSVCGLIVTAILTGGAVRERNRLLRLIFYPKHVNSLRERCDQLSILLGSSEPPAVISRVIGQTRGDLNSLRRYLQKGQRATFRQILELLDNYDLDRTDVSLNRLLGKMYQIEQEMRNLSEGLRY